MCKYQLRLTAVVEFEDFMKCLADLFLGKFNLFVLIYIYIMYIPFSLIEN